MIEYEDDLNANLNKEKKLSTFPSEMPIKTNIFNARRR